MATGPKAVPRLDLPTLLGTATLRLVPDLRTATTRGNLIVVKNDSDARYLVITRPQWQLLQRFTQGRTVSDALCEIISEDHCPPLREFYDLVVRGYQHSILQVVGQDPPVWIRPVRWWLKIPPPVARIGSVVLLSLSTVILLVAGVHVPRHSVDVVGGTLLAVATASLAQLLAACVLKGAKCQVFRPRFQWRRTPLPRFRVELEEAVMGGRETEINVALVRMVPAFTLAAAAAIKFPTYSLPLLAAVFVQLSPLWRTPMWDLLRALFRDPRLSTRTSFVFAASKPFALLAQARQQFSDRRFLLAGTSVTIVWLALVFVVGCLLFQANAVDLLHRFYLAGGLRYTGIIVVGALATVILGIVGLVLWIIASQIRAWWRERIARRRRLQITGHSPEEVAKLLAGIVLFRDLPPEPLREVAAAMKTYEYQKDQYVIRVGEDADRMYVVVAGRLEVIRHYDDGRAQAVAEMVPGDVLGEIGIVRGSPRTRSIRSATPAILLGLDKEAFERLVLPHLTRADVEEAVQKVGFLQNISLMREWPQQTLAAFARLAVIQEFNEGELVIREGSENLNLYLVHRGEFSVTQHGKQIRKLRQGDSYGEFGLLQNRNSASSVVATMPSSCLVISKGDFLKFITQDFMISLQFEQVGAKGTGRRVFSSAKGPGFDVLRA
ncbi:MAG: cyclic nucleotide-binding domain-containing protein [Verrucomicrobia bacterium]|nr:cyclic nucleotide-binding domain-containing protein [Verrucomicrobiota bacterium]